MNSLTTTYITFAIAGILALLLLLPVIAFAGSIIIGVIGVIV